MLEQEENKILDKMHRQKVAEVEKLSTTVSELEEAVLAGGAAANAVRERQRQVNQLLVHKFSLLFLKKFSQDSSAPFSKTAIYTSWSPFLENDYEENLESIFDRHWLI